MIAIMRCKLFITWAALLFVACLTTAARADTIVTQWNLTTAVADSSGPSTILDGDISTVVTNPFVDSHQTFLPPAEFANTQFDFSWVEEADVGSFESTFEHNLTLGDHQTGSSGFIRLTTTVPLLLDVTAVMNFTSSPADEADFLLTVGAADLTVPIGFFSETEFGGGAHFGEPASGTNSISATDILIPAGSTLTITHDFKLSSILEDTLTAPMHADGFVNWSFTPVPEPTTLFLLPWAALAWRGVHKRRHTRQ